MEHAGHWAAAPDFASAVDRDPLLIKRLGQILTKRDFQKTLDRVKLLKENFSSEQSLSQFINITKAQNHATDIYVTVMKALKSQNISQ